MAKITNSVLHEKIKGLHYKLDLFLPDVKKNTEFRNKAYGFATALTLFGGLVGAGIMKFFNFRFPGK